MSDNEHTIEYTIEGWRAGHWVIDTVRAFDVKEARKAARRVLGIEPVRIANYKGLVWAVKMRRPQNVHK